MTLELSQVTVEDLVNSADNLSKVDAQISDLYHILEYCNLDAISLVRVAKELQNTLKVRRRMKEIRAISQQLAVDKFNPRFTSRESKYKAEAQLCLTSLKQTWNK